MIVFAKAERKPPQRRFIEQSPDDEWWQRSHRIADLYYPLLAKAFTDALESWRDATEPFDVFQALIASNIAMAESIVNIAWDRQVEPIYRETMRQVAYEAFVRAAEVVKPHLESVLSVHDPRVAQIGIQFGGPASPRVIQWADQYAASEVRYVGDASKQAMRSTIRRHFEQGLNPQQMAREIRQFIGLTDKQASAVARFRQGMVDAGISPSIIERRVQSRVNRMIRDRAKLIARNESHYICQSAHHEMLMDSAAQGLLDVERARRFWIITPGSRTCKYCLPVPGMNPEGVRLQEPFQTPLGPTLIAHLHITCRCAEGIRFVD